MYGHVHLNRFPAHASHHHPARWHHRHCHLQVLDMCAAPGSKTFQLLELLHAGTDSSGPTGGYAFGTSCHCFAPCFASLSEHLKRCCLHHTYPVRTTGKRADISITAFIRIATPMVLPLICDAVHAPYGEHVASKCCFSSNAHAMGAGMHLHRMQKPIMVCQGLGQTLHRLPLHPVAQIVAVNCNIP